ncbi:MAG: hypothetical protein IT304_04955, partial [Dehalococcoidia bacterium]|nr:hypothetical protein [Dehalococcoidia bacterium]
AGGAIHESNCDFSGACIDVCPTAALMEHPNKWVSKPDTWTTTTCDSCAIGCSIKLGSKDGRGVIVRPGFGNPVSSDQICVRGRYHYDSLKPRERLSRHLVRRGAIHVPVSLEEAATEAARVLRAANGRVGVLVGATATNEEAWLAQRIAREAFSTTADSALGPVMRAVRSALEARLGTWRAAGDMTRVATSKTIVLVHDDLEESHNVASVRIKDAVVREGAQLVVIGALRSELVDFAAAWLRPAPGEEGQVAGALAEAVQRGGPDGHADLAGALDILKAAPLDDTLVVCAPSPVSPEKAAAMAGGAANLAVALFGNRASENLVVLPAEVNIHGLMDLGVGVSGPVDPLADLAGLVVFRDDPTLRLPGAASALAQIPALVVVDNVLHETARRASAVIAEGRPYATGGTFTQGDFRVQRLAPAIHPEGAAVSGLAALAALGAALGLDLPDDPDDALGEITREHPVYQTAYDLLVGEGVRLPMPVGQKGTIAPVEPFAAREGMRVICARDLYTAEDAAALRHPEADRLHRYDRIQVSEEDAARLGISDNDEIEISDGTLTVRAPATVTERVPAGAVFVSSLLQGGVAVGFFAAGPLPTVRLGVAVPV